MGGLAARTHLAGSAQQPLKRRLRAQPGAFIEQDRPHLSRGQVGEPVAVRNVEYGLLLGGAQRPRLAPLAVRHTDSGRGGAGLCRCRRE